MRAAAQSLVSDGDLSILDEFKTRLAELSLSSPVAGFSPLLEPYIVTHHQAGIDFKLIIFNEQTREWYDNEHPEATFAKYVKFDLVKPGDVVFDLGCNVGFTTMWFGLKTGSRGKVFAFDIFPWCTLAVQYNARLNGLNNICPITLGLGGSVYMRDIVAAESSIHHTMSLRKRAMIGIHVVPLDCFADLNPDFIKCDIEAAEYEMLAGARRVLAVHPALMIELHYRIMRQLKSDPLDVLRELDAAGYDVYLDAPFARRFDGTTVLSDNVEVYALPKSTAVPEAGKARASYVSSDRRSFGFAALIKRSLRVHSGKTY